MVLPFIWNTFCILWLPHFWKSYPKNSHANQGKIWKLLLYLQVSHVTYHFDCLEEQNTFLIKVLMFCDFNSVRRPFSNINISYIWRWLLFFFQKGVLYYFEKKKGFFAHCWQPSSYIYDIFILENDLLTELKAQSIKS